MSELLERHEIQLQEIVDRAVAAVHREVSTANSPTVQSLALSRVALKLIESLVIERQTEIIKDALTNGTSKFKPLW